MWKSGFFVKIKQAKINVPFCAMFMAMATYTAYAVDIVASDCHDYDYVCGGKNSGCAVVDHTKVSCEKGWTLSSDRKTCTRSPSTGSDNKGNYIETYGSCAPTEVPCFKYDTSCTNQDASCIKSPGIV
ncbi:hypothetical protein HDR61_00035 [bacterium]|nr:hypothetical protein [bacterium]